MTNQRLYIQLPLSHQIQDRLKIPLFRPSYKPYRIIMSLFFIFRIVSPRPIRTGNLEGQLLFIKIRAFEFKTRHPNQDNSSPFPTHPGCLLNGLITLSRGCDDNAIHAASSGKSHSRIHKFFTLRQINRLSPKLPCQFTLCAVKINPHDPAPIGLQNLHSQEPDQSQTRNDKTFTNRRLRQPHPLQPDRPNHGKSRSFIRHTIRNLRTKIPRHTNHLRMWPIRYNSISDRKGRR